MKKPSIGLIVCLLLISAGVIYGSFWAKDFKAGLALAAEVYAEPIVIRRADLSKFLK